MDLNLDRVRAKVMKLRGWKETRARAAETEYRRFLQLIAENPGETIVPWSGDLDEFWHTHIQDTRQYGEDCKRLFGRFIHHDPHIEHDPERHHEAWDRTKRMYAAAFVPTSYNPPKRKEEPDRSWISDLFEGFGELIQGVADSFSSIGCGGGHSCSSDGGHGCGGSGDGGGCGAGCGGGCGGS